MGRGSSRSPNPTKSRFASRSYVKPVPRAKSKPKGFGSQRKPGARGKKLKPKKFKPQSEEDAKLAETIELGIIHRGLDVMWEDIAELHVAKRLLREAVILPQLKPEAFTGLRKP